MPETKSIALEIAKATGVALALDTMRHVGGGCINDAMMLSGGGLNYFVKTNRADLLDMFEAEADGLSEISECGAIRAPRPICHGVTDGRAFLVLEHIEFRGNGSMGLFGEQLAQMHRTISPEFGWNRDNTIGSTPQTNRRCRDWVWFLRDHRLGYQLNLAASNGHPDLRRKAERLMQNLGSFFSDYQPEPSLLHGDLWGGNYGFDKSGNPVIFDPAVYYGDREADIAMTELFGGFGRDFYTAYKADYPLDPGYRVRKELYNLYHILNHLNLFGGGYYSQAANMIQHLDAELG